jgi:hypothetical protein
VPKSSRVGKTQNIIMKKLPLVASILLMGGGVANATEKITCLVKKELLLILEMKNQLRSQKEELSSTYLSMGI